MAQPSQAHCCDPLIELFNDLFATTENTQLVRGADEPLYLPATEQHPRHRIIFAHGYFASALHEIAHWLVAGPERRLQQDFGYWYRPDGRSAAEQAEFEQVEVKPQALEWILARACGFRFRTSSDNLSGEGGDPEGFRRAVLAQVRRYLQQGLNPRADRLVRALAGRYHQPLPVAADFHLADL
nr:elongation factor P hydroxylase [Motiliproteus sediminis]